MSTDIIVCAFHQYGHCKFGSFCRKKHTIETCTDHPCTLSNCLKRHPKPCKYFVMTGHCKFLNNCSYSHFVNTLEKETEKEVAKLKSEVEMLKAEIADMKILLKEISSPNPTGRDPAPTTSSSRSTNSSITVVMESIPSILEKNKSEFNIPQYDGLTQSADIEQESNTTSMKTFQCEFCSFTFESMEALKVHNDTHEYCCEECLICYDNQEESDMHELEVHPGSHYANNYVPNSTKVLFNKRKGIIL